MEWNHVMEWNGMEWNGMESWNGIMECNGMEWNGMEWNGMEWNGIRIKNNKELKHKMRIYGYIQVYKYIINHTHNFDGVINSWISRTNSRFYVFRKNIIFIGSI